MRRFVHATKRHGSFRRSIGYLYLLIFLILPVYAEAQQNITINLAPIDGVALTPANIFGYQIYATGTGNVIVKGTIRYRNSDLYLSYSFNYVLRQGSNTLSPDLIHPSWQFSTGALQELFFHYNVLPSGTFEYCVVITPSATIKENNGSVFEECLYHRSDEFFLINLVDPADKSKLKEYNPLLTWVANYSFSGELTYRLRVAEIKQGQNAVNAVMRNQPMFDEKNLIQNSIVYPIYARPLQANQPYAWTVDAYYKGILLGGAETWQFIILDSVSPTAISNRSYIDIKRETGLNKLTAIGNLKLKYVLDDAQNDSLYIEIVNDKNKKCPLNPEKLTAVYGDNRYVLNLTDSCSLKHHNKYTLKIKTRTKHEYKLSFEYQNPDFLR